MKRRTPKQTLAQKLREPNVAYLLGAGASFCAGLPGTVKLTSLIRSELRSECRATFERITGCLSESGVENPTIEEVLSELCHRFSGAGTEPAEKLRCEAAFREACQCIQRVLEVDHPTEYHKDFVVRAVSRREAEPATKAPPVQIFTTNYDLLLELACEESDVVVINGFEGIFRRRWNPASFDCDIGRATSHPQTPRFEHSARHIRLYKLHGSLSWFEDEGGFCEDKPSPGSERVPLIIYPSRLKYAESTRSPFDWLFRRFGAALQEAKLLICIGYGFGDDTLNHYIFAQLRNRLSLLALSKEPIDALGTFGAHRRLSVINEKSTIIDGHQQGSATDLWAFERFATWLPALKEKRA